MVLDIQASLTGYKSDQTIQSWNQTLCFCHRRHKPQPQREEIKRNRRNYNEGKSDSFLFAQQRVLVPQEFASVVLNSFFSLEGFLKNMLAGAGQLFCWLARLLVTRQGCGQILCASVAETREREIAVGKVAVFGRNWTRCLFSVKRWQWELFCSSCFVCLFFFGGVYLSSLFICAWCLNAKIHTIFAELIEY